MKRRGFFYVGTTIALLLFIHCAFVLVLGTGPLQLATAGYFRQQLRTRMSLARRRWQQHQVREYEIGVTFTNVSPIWFVCRGTGPVTLQVRDGVVVEAVGYDLDTCGEIYQSLTINAMFNRVAADIESYDPLKSDLHVKFDPEWGYVAKYRIENNQPIWSAIADAFSQVEIHEFRPLP